MYDTLPFNEKVWRNVNITFRTAGEVVKRWVNEVQESIREENKLCFLEFAHPLSSLFFMKTQFHIKKTEN